MRACARFVIAILCIMQSAVFGATRSHHVSRLNSAAEYDLTYPVIDSLVTLRLDPSLGDSAAIEHLRQFAAMDTSFNSWRYGGGLWTIRVNPGTSYSDAREELVRGAELIGTPLAVLESIQAAGNDLGVFNGVCGAESGWVPVSAIAPSVLIGEIEVQRLDRNLKRGPILPPPLHDPGA